MASWLRCDRENLLHTNLFSGAGVIKRIINRDFDQLSC